MASEKNYENKIKSYIRAMGGCGYVLKTFGNGWQANGTPDLICCINGRFVAIEVKSESGKSSPLQLERLEQIKKAGGVAIVSKPSQWEELKETLNSVN